MKQLDLFIKSNIDCECGYINHSLTDHDYKENLIKLEKIKNIITETGLDLSDNYYFFHKKLDFSCNAWDMENKEYLIMRNKFNDKLKELYLPLI